MAISSIDADHRPSLKGVARWRMPNSGKSFLALILTAAMLSACGEYRHCSPGDRIDIAELEEAAKQNNLEKIWGKPVKRQEIEDGRVGRGIGR